MSDCLSWLSCFRNVSVHGGRSEDTPSLFQGLKVRMSEVDFGSIPFPVLAPLAPENRVTSGSGWTLFETSLDSPVCERVCIFRFSRREKLLLQVGQWCGFSLVCVRMWISILYLWNMKRGKENVFIERTHPNTQYSAFEMSGSFFFSGDVAADIWAAPNTIQQKCWLCKLRFQLLHVCTLCSIVHLCFQPMFLFADTTVLPVLRLANVLDPTDAEDRRRLTNWIFKLKFSTNKLYF